MSSYPICKNCANCCEGDEEFICESDVAIMPDLVRGGVFYLTCEEMRINPMLCGKGGFLFKENEDFMNSWNK